MFQSCSHLSPAPEEKSVRDKKSFRLVFWSVNYLERCHLLNIYPFQNQSSFPHRMLRMIPESGRDTIISKSNLHKVELERYQTVAQITLCQ